MSATPMFGIGELRDRRGEERVTFNELADQLVEFADRSPNDATVVDALASFLARAEGSSRARD
jgi:Family of unknown function (DUF6104)